MARPAHSRHPFYALDGDCFIRFGRYLWNVFLFSGKVLLMERREFVTALGAAAAVAVSLPSLRRGEPASSTCIRPNTRP